MGGVIGFTLREENGTEHRMSRWTNWTPWAIDNINLVHKSPAHIEDILFQWKKQLLLPEQKRNCYYKEPFLAPSEYGLVVVDFLKNKILDCNHYHKFGAMNSVSLQISNNDKDRFHQFFKEGRIKDCLVYEHDKKKSIWEDLKTWSFEKIIKAINEDLSSSLSFDERKLGHGEFVLDMSPFEVVSFEEMADLRQAILDLGFLLTEEEEAIWEKHIKG